MLGPIKTISRLLWFIRIAFCEWIRLKYRKLASLRRTLCFLNLSKRNSTSMTQKCLIGRRRNTYASLYDVVLTKFDVLIVGVAGEGRKTFFGGHLRFVLINTWPSQCKTTFRHKTHNRGRQIPCKGV